jgi:hypothetical protein
MFKQWSHAVTELLTWRTGNHSGVDVNFDAGAVGSAVLIWGIFLLLRHKPRISAPALAWTLCVGAVTLTSYRTPPNPRMLICAFPALMAIAARLRGRSFYALCTASVLLLVVMSPFTYWSQALRP